MANSKTLSPDQASLLLSVVQLRHSTITTAEWTQIAENLNISNGKAAKERLRYLLKQLSESVGLRKRAAPKISPEQRPVKKAISRKRRTVKAAEDGKQVARKPESSKGKEAVRTHSRAEDSGQFDELDELDELLNSTIQPDHLADMFDSAN